MERIPARSSSVSMLVAQLGSKAQLEDRRTLRQVWCESSVNCGAVLAHQGFHVGPYRIRPLGRIQSCSLRISYKIAMP